jgi:hypothetical protein
MRPAARRDQVEPVAVLLDQFQGNRRTRAQAFLQFRLIGLRRRLDPPQHRIAQRLQFRIVDPIELDPEFQDRDRNQLCRVAITVRDEGRLALLKCCQHSSQIFFKISHSVFPLPSQRDDQCYRTTGGSTPPHTGKSDSIRTEKIDFVVTQICDIARQSSDDSAVVSAFGAP